MFSIWVVFHVIVCIALVIVVLLQSSKGEGLAGSAFGGGGGSGLSGAVFGGRGAASFLSKATSALAIVFMVNCIALAYMSAGTRTGVTGTGGEATSVVTEKAQAERERALQQQQQQLEQSQQGDSVINVIPNEAAGDTSGN